MPANRSRTERWRDCLQQIYERGGGIEFSLDRCKVPQGAEASAEPQVCIPDLMWRVRVIGLSENEILVESPGAAGSLVPIADKCGVIGVMSVGQNRWMFHSKLLGPGDGPSPWGNTPGGLRLAMPTNVERCHRREFLRISTAELHLPTVECWPLMNPMTVGPAEDANRLAIKALQNGEMSAHGAEQAGRALLPEVGPQFTAQLLNIGGGGVGLIFSKEEAAAADRSRLIWMRIDLRPVIAAPIAITAKIVHKHLDSSQSLHAGAAFDFSFNPSHREFVVDQIVRYVNKLGQISKAA